MAINDKQLETEQKKEPLSIQEQKIRAGIAFPLDYEDIASLKQSLGAFLIVQLSNGYAEISDSQIQATSIILATHRAFSTTVGLLQAWCDNGKAYIQSSTTDDNSQINVVIFY